MGIFTALASDDNLTGIAAWAVSIMESLGGLGVAFLIAVENLFPPLPSEIILPLAGFTASQGTSFNLAEAIIWATAGSLVGAWALYGIARIIGRERTRAIFNWLPLVKISDVDKTEAWFHKHDQSTVFFGRMLPIFRSLISLPAGVIKMNFLKFTVLTTLGAAIWNTTLIGAGYILGENWHLVDDYVGILSKIVLVAILALLLWWVVRRLRKTPRE
ncbi:DedA family protein [Trueperella pyogenes]|uniref:DedA family protein n=1 Tax=Trueperella pyogenes TaxID=1661 RepID=UPI00215C6114|nr:DedA family protein [Trueperella pyogenes]UVJ59594.1 DedA family protein [Trueperella pyogenes]